MIGAVAASAPWLHRRRGSHGGRANRNRRPNQTPKSRARSSHGVAVALGDAPSQRAREARPLATGRAQTTRRRGSGGAGKRPWATWTAKRSARKPDNANRGARAPNAAPRGGRARAPKARRRRRRNREGDGHTPGTTATPRPNCPRCAWRRRRERPFQRARRRAKRPGRHRQRRAHWRPDGRTRRRRWGTTLGRTRRGNRAARTRNRRGERRERIGT